MFVVDICDSFLGVCELQSHRFRARETDRYIDR